MSKQTVVKLTVEQANALLVAEPFAIVQVVYDEEGYYGKDFEPTLLASNVMLQPKELKRIVSDDLSWEEGENGFASCFVTYLFNMEWMAESYPQIGGYLEATEVIVLATEPIVLGTDEEAA